MREAIFLPLIRATSMKLMIAIRYRGIGSAPISGLTNFANFPMVFYTKSSRPVEGSGPVKLGQPVRVERLR